MSNTTIAISSAFAVLCAAANWNSTSIYKKATSTTTINIDGAQLIILICAIILFFLIRSIYKSIRICLDQGIRIPKQIKFIDWAPCLLLTPMFVSWGYSSSETTPEGFLHSYSYGYGSQMSSYALIVAALTILTFQVTAGFSMYRDKTEQGAAANP
jgi:hypothetical protein